MLRIGTVGRQPFALPDDFVTETTAVLAKRGAGKALALDTPLPSPDGWTTMQEISVGDSLFDEHGTPCKVVYVAPIQFGNSCYRVRFSDGSSIVADGDHLWLSDTLASRRAAALERLARSRGVRPGAEVVPGRPQCVRRTFPKLVTTTEMRRTLTVKVGQRLDRNHSISTCQPLQLPHIELPIDPYVLGLWLGDGTAQNAYVTTPDLEVFDHVRAAGYTVGEPRGQSGRAWSYWIGKRNGGPSLVTTLKHLGLKNNKRVPPVYLRASVAQRRALLAGLMDSDGTISAHSNSCCFDTMKPHLADAIYELVVSLGWVARHSSKIAKLNGKIYGDCHRVTFRPTEQVFWLKRKADRFNPNVSQKSRAKRRIITSIDPVDSVPVRCIAVDSPSHLFLAGTACIPTHNTYYLRLLTETMVDASLPVVVIDPVGVCWGLRSSADGKHPGLPVIIFGGDHGDLPLEAESGKVLADFVITERRPVVLDLSALPSKASECRFVADFATHVYRHNREPLHIMLDEADNFAPQQPMQGDKRMLGAINLLARRGRARGIGMTMATQRSAVLNKNVLTQAEVLVAMRMTAPQDRKAIEAWIEYHGTKEDRRGVLSSLGDLPVGTAWFWSPGRLNGLSKVKIGRCRTFDSSATPKAGKRTVRPRLGPVDLPALNEQIRATVERAKRDDPQLLRHRIVELERQLAKRPSKTERVEVPVPVVHALAPDVVRDIENEIDAARDALNRAVDYVLRLKGLADKARKAANVPRTPVPAAPAEPPPSTLRSRPDPPVGDRQLSGGQRKLLTALAQFGSCTKRRLAALTGYKSGGGHFNNMLSGLRVAGWTCRGEPVAITEAGRAALGPFDPLPTGRALFEMWCRKLGKAPRLCLEQLYDAYPRSLSRERLAELTGYTTDGGHFTNTISRLSTLGLLDRTTEGLRATENLFT